MMLSLSLLNCGKWKAIIVKNIREKAFLSKPKSKSLLLCNVHNLVFVLKVEQLHTYTLPKCVYIGVSQKQVVEHSKHKTKPTMAP